MQCVRPSATKLLSKAYSLPMYLYMYIPSRPLYVSARRPEDTVPCPAAGLLQPTDSWGLGLRTSRRVLFGVCREPGPMNHIYITHQMPCDPNPNDFATPRPVFVCNETAFLDRLSE